MGKQQSKETELEIYNERGLHWSRLRGTLLDARDERHQLGSWKREKSASLLIEVELGQVSDTE